VHLEMVAGTFCQLVKKTYESRQPRTDNKLSMTQEFLIRLHQAFDLYFVVGKKNTGQVDNRM
jgi:hypothetical protein